MDKKTKDRITKVGLHLLIWAFILGLPWYSAKKLELESKFLLIAYTFTAINGLIFYMNYLVLVPKLFFQKKKFRYYSSALALLIFFYFVSGITNKILFDDLTADRPARKFDRPSDNRPAPGPPKVGVLRRIPYGDAHFMGYTSSALFLIFLSLGIRVLERQSEIEKLQEEMEKTRLNTELAFLKNQISPHFFFNTLNNIYSLIGINQEDSQNAVLKLSKLMRYLLYESEQGNTMLSSEIGFLNNYIDLMKLRMTDKIDLKVSFPEKFDDVSLPPLLFVPFIENAFKHGVSYRERSFIDISMRSGKDNITFRCANTLLARKEDGESSHSGIGLDNVKKRLNLLFPGRHDLKISANGNVFEVLLFINFA